MNKKNILIYILIILLTSTVTIFASNALNSSNVAYNNANGMNSTNVQDAIDELYLDSLTACEKDVVVKVATNFYNAGVNSFTVMEKSGAEASVFSLSYKTNTKTDKKSGTSDPLYLYKDPNNNYGVITAINIPVKGSAGGAFGYGTASFTASIKLMTDTGIELDSVSFNSTVDKTITWKPANYNIDENVNYVYISWEASGTATITQSDYSQYNASFSFMINPVTAEYLPLN